MKTTNSKRFEKVEKNNSHGFIINEKIREDSMRVISGDGDNLGLLTRAEALELAKSVSLDLVQIGKGEDGTATVKLLDFGKFLYEKKKQQTETKKHTKTIDVKEIKFRLGIDVGDYGFKVNKIVDFLNDGDHVKITLQFRGREMQLKNIHGAEFFTRVLEDVKLRLETMTAEYQKESGGGNLWTKVLVAKKK